MSDTKLFSPEEVSVLLGVHRETVYRYIKQGKLQMMKVGPRHVRITQESINAFINASNGKVASKPTHTPLDVTS